MPKDNPKNQNSKPNLNGTESALGSYQAPPNPFNLSLDLRERGRILAPEGYLVAEDVFKHLLERLDAELMAKRVESEYVAYGIGASLQAMVNAINISAITNDKGDDHDQLPQMPDYNYAEECEEPAAARIDMHALKN